MNILETLVQLRDDLKTWVTNNLNALNKKIDEKTIPIDSELSATSTNPVQNKAINAEISSLNNLIGDTSVATQISIAIANQDLFSGDYNDLQNAPNISDDDSSNLKVSDEDGNIIVQIDSDGLKTTKITANNVNINGTNILEDTSGKVELVDENGNVIVKVDNDGIHTTEIKADGIKIKETLSNHIDNNNIHVTIEEKTLWNSKSDFSGDYNDLKNAPDIAEDDTSDLTIADEVGNIIFKVDAAGAHTTTLDAQNITINNENIDNVMDKKITALVNSAPETLDTLGELAKAMGEHEDAYDALLETVGQKATREEVKDLEKALNNGAESEAEEYCIADKNDNMIFKVDKEGVETTAVKTKALTVDGKNLATHIKDAIDDIDFPETDLTDYATKQYVKEQVGPKAAQIDLDETNQQLGMVKELVGTSSVEDQIEEALDNFYYSDLINAPEINNYNDKEFYIIDDAENAIFKVDENGVYVTELFLNGVNLTNLLDKKLEEDGVNEIVDNKIKNSKDTFTELINEVSTIDYRSTLYFNTDERVTSKTSALFSKQTLTFEKSSDGTTLSYTFPDDKFINGIVEGKTYKVVLDNISYDLVAQKHVWETAIGDWLWLLIGNQSLGNPDYPDTGDNILLLGSFDSSGVGRIQGIAIPYAAQLKHTIEIYEYV